MRRVRPQLLLHEDPGVVYFCHKTEGLAGQQGDYVNTKVIFYKLFLLYYNLQVTE